MVKSKKINVGISIGDPNGIGIEVMLKALSDRPPNDNCNFIIYFQVRNSPFLIL